MTSTAEAVTKAADDVRAAIAAYNEAAERAVRLGLKVELRPMLLQTMMGDVELLTVQVFEPR